MRDVPRNFLIEKCTMDARLALYCWNKLLPQKTQSYTIDRNIIHILRHMEKKGIAIAQDVLDEFYFITKQETEYLRQIIQAKFGCDPNSNKQVGVVLSKDIRLPMTASRKQYKVDEETLMRYPDHPLIITLLQYREKAKLKSTYVDPLMGLDRIYPRYNSTVVVTGRLSSSNPNAQNIPEYFRSVLKADSWFSSLDANQLELRVVAWLSQDKTMLEALARGEDMHTATQRELGIKDRKDAKVANFSVVYGSEANPELMTRFFTKYTGVRDWIEDTKRTAVQTGMVRTMFGRIRRLPVDKTIFNSISVNYQQKILREMVNMPVQGTAVEIIKIGMANAKDYDTRIQVHDEVVYDGVCPTKSCYENLVQFPVPMKLKVGLDWGNMEEYKW
jgi:DNA polymerase-1